MHPVHPIGTVDQHPSAGGSPFVGRERELSELRAGLDAALARNGAAYLIAGEPGIGKTRLASEFAREAAHIGTWVFRGCSVEESGAPPYWPWIQMVRTCLADCPPDLARTGTSLVSALFPELLPDARPAYSAAVAPDSEAARFRVFDGVATLFRELSALAPVVIVLDDLQWADDSSLLLLQFLARNLSGMRLLLVATYRDVEARLSPEAGRRIAALACDARTIRLGGLTGSEVALLIERTTRTPPPQGLAVEVHRGTGGNPLFVDEVLRTLATEGRLEQPVAAGMLPLPDRVRALIRHRTRLVSLQCRRVLSVAATLGRDCDLGVLDRVCAMRGDRPLDVIDEARAAGILTTSDGRVAFAHDLFREVLYDDLGERERGELHAHVGVALEGLHAGELHRHLPELAHHFFRAGLAESEKAVAYSIRAAERAARGLAFSETVGHYKRALERLSGSDTGNAAQRCQILLALGESLWNTGEFDEAKQIYESAAELAEGAHLAEELARARAAGGDRIPLQLPARAEPQPAGVAPARPPDNEAVFRREGEYWTLAYRGKTVRLRASRGLSLISVLLRHPGTEFHAADLDAGPNAADSIGTRDALQEGLRVGRVHAEDELLDPRAKAEYRVRIQELQQEIDDAEQSADTARAGRAHAEREALERELVAAVGLGGRTRRRTSEGLRLRVTKAIRASIRRVEREHPDLGEFLTRAIVTGTFCSYQPPPSAPVRWTL